MTAMQMRKRTTGAKESSRRPGSSKGRASVSGLLSGLGGSGSQGTGQAPGAAATGTAEAAAEGEGEQQRTVIAECYKITPQEGHHTERTASGAAGGVAGSITM